MSNTPSETEIDNLLCKHWPAYSMQAVLVKMWLREAIKSAIAKWGSPPPVAREPAPVVPAAPAPSASPAFVYAGERGADLEDLLDGYDHGTAFYPTPQPSLTAQAADSVQEDAALEKQEGEA